MQIPTDMMIGQQVSYQLSPCRPVAIDEWDELLEDRIVSGGILQPVQCDPFSCDSLTIISLVGLGSADSVADRGNLESASANWLLEPLTCLTE